MIVLRRRAGEVITIGEARVLVRDIGKDEVLLLIDAPLEVTVRRGMPRVVERDESTQAKEATS